MSHKKLLRNLFATIKAHRNFLSHTEAKKHAFLGRHRFHKQNNWNS